jgi:hypothetical protein
MATVTIRVPLQTHRRIVRLAEKRGEKNLGAVVDEATRRLEDEEFWAEVNAGYARLRADPVASAEFDAEVAAWDATLTDGLEGDRWEE